MKKVIAIIMMVLISFIMAEQFKVNRLAPVYTEQSPKSGVVGYTIKGNAYEILEKVSSYHFVEVLEAPKTENVGKKAWVTAPIVKTLDGVSVIIDSGCTMRSQPKKMMDGKNTSIGFLMNGAKVKIIKSNVIKVKIKFCECKQGWMFVSNGSIIQ